MGDRLVARLANSGLTRTLWYVVAVGCSSAARLECSVDAECSDGNVCNGEELCVGHRCTSDVPLDCDDAVECTVDVCSEERASCVNFPDHGACDPAELCDPVAGCVRVEGCTDDRRCDDGFFCNGEELCDDSVCVAGPLPDCDDSDRCTEDICDVAVDECVGTPFAPDIDGDGYGDASCGGDDCDESDPSVHPGAPEVCAMDGPDDDCDGQHGCEDTDCRMLEYCGGPPCVPSDVIEVDRFQGPGGCCGASVWQRQRMDEYSCGVDGEYGPELVYQYDVSIDCVIEVSIGDVRCYWYERGEVESCPHELMTDTDIFILRDAGLGCDNLSCVAAAATRGLDEESVRFEATAGSTYYVVLDGPDDGLYGGDCDLWLDYFEGYPDYLLPDYLGTQVGGRLVACHGTLYTTSVDVYPPEGEGR